MKAFEVFEVMCIGIICLFLGIYIGIIIINTGNYSFCPECGRRYMEARYCEYDGTKLEETNR